nr:MAG TPA: hypothetical protein [Crassvirales sp.]
MGKGLFLCSFFVPKDNKKRRKEEKKTTKR